MDFKIENLNGKRISLRHHAYFEIGDDPTNCKLSYIHGLGNYNYVDKEKLIEDLNHALQTQCKGAVIINTISEKVADVILDNYQVYYFQKVPIGYNNKFQYHICIRNHISINLNCKIPKKYDKLTLKGKLVHLFKSKRRKLDIIDDILNLL